MLNAKKARQSRIRRTGLCYAYIVHDTSISPFEIFERGLCRAAQSQPFWGRCRATGAVILGVSLLVAATAQAIEDSLAGVVEEATRAAQTRDDRGQEGDENDDQDEDEPPGHATLAHDVEGVCSISDPRTLRDMVT